MNPTAREKLTLSWKIHDEFKDVISAKHDGQELIVTIPENYPKTKMNKLIEYVIGLNKKMYCIRTREKILADERGKKDA